MRKINEHHVYAGPAKYAKLDKPKLWNFLQNGAVPFTRVKVGKVKTRLSDVPPG